MLSRIARGLHDLGGRVERSQHVARILEVNHKMNLERDSFDAANVWIAISESFECGLDHPDEVSLYDEFALSQSHPYSLKRCIEEARDEGRAMRDHISEEMWLHLNRAHLDVAALDFDAVVRMGRSEFNRLVEIYGDALFGLADTTMIRDEAWAFLRVGRFVERAMMICRVLEIKRKTLSLSPDSEGAPLEVHQWQGLLRSLSGYEPYRRVYDARIVPEQVLDFVLRRRGFPRSLTCALHDLSGALDFVSGSSAAQIQLQFEVERLLEVVQAIDPRELVARGSFESELRDLECRLAGLSASIELAFFTSIRPASVPIAAAPNASLVPQ